MEFSKYSRYLEIFVTYMGNYDFESDIPEMEQIRLERIRERNQSIPGLSSIKDEGETALNSYRKIYVPIEQINNMQSTPEVSAQIIWVSDPRHAGKIRINAHGDGVGNIFMHSAPTSDTQPIIFSAHANSIATWLFNNNLRNASGLRTIMLNVCLAAQGRSAAATRSSAQRRLLPAADSVISLLALTLRKLNIRGIRVTGSNEITKTLGGWTHAVVATINARLGDSGRLVPDHTKHEFTWIVDIPVGWDVRLGTPNKLISQPATVEPDPENVRNLPTGGWLVTLLERDPTCPKRTVKIPEGWHLLKKTIPDYYLRSYLPRFFGYSQTHDVVEVSLPYGLNVRSYGEYRGGIVSLSELANQRHENESYFKAEVIS